MGCEKDLIGLVRLILGTVNKSPGRSGADAASWGDERWRKDIDRGRETL